MSIFNNESILAWLKYFSDHSEIDLSTVRILDITGENRNLLPTVQANRSVLVFTDGNHPEIFYSMWDEGMGDCEIWYNEGSEPQGPMKHNLLSEMIDRGVNVSAAMLINNPRAHSGYRIGLDNDSFSPGTIRYVAPEIRAVILKKLCLDEKETICCVSGESIAVEAAIAVRRGHVVAVEYKPGDRQTMEENVVRFGLNNVLIVDDMIDTAGTICMAADMLMARGAKSVRAAITHPVLSGPAYERINDSALEEVIVTDTIPLNPDKDLHKFTVLTIADMFADVIERVHNYKEISSIFFK